MLWKEIRPQMSYRVRTRRPIAESEIKVISHLYLPIIHANAYSLYLFLYHQTSPDHWVSGEVSHQFLMLNLGLDLEEIVAAREKLEAVGLLSTYRYKDQEGYEYYLQPPLTPYEFFQSDVLSLLLLNRIGQSNYRKIYEKYSLPLSMRYQSELMKEEITKRFSDVFSSLQLSEVAASPHSETRQFLKKLDDEHQILQFHSRWEPPQVSTLEIDFECLEPLFAKEDRPILFSEENKRLISNYAFRYGLKEEQIGIMLKDSYKTSKKEWDINRFEELAKKYFRAQASAAQERPVQSDGDVQPTSVEQHLAFLKIISPLQLLRNYQNGGQVSKPDEKLIDYLLNDLGLREEVVNVLIDYVLLTNDNKLPRAITEKIASSWKRKGFTTAEEAFRYAQEEYVRSKSNYMTKSASATKATRTKKKQVPEYIWLQVERDRIEEKERERKQMENKVSQEELDRLIQELEEKR